MKAELSISRVVVVAVLSFSALSCGVGVESPDGVDTATSAQALTATKTRTADAPVYIDSSGRTSTAPASPPPILSRLTFCGSLSDCASVVQTGTQGGSWYTPGSGTSQQAGCGGSLGLCVVN